MPLSLGVLCPCSAIAILFIAVSATQNIVFNVMVFYVTAVTFVMPFLMNKIANNVTSIYLWVVHFWHILHPNISVMKYCHK